MSPLLKEVELSGIEGMQKKRLPYKISGVDFFDLPQESRKLFATLINAPSFHSISVLPSVSYGMGIVAKNLVAQKGQNIVSVSEEFPSNVYAWREHCAQGVELRLVAPNMDIQSRTEVWNEEILKSIDDNTVLVVLSTVHWTDGTLFDLKKIGEKAKKVGAMFVLDGTQSIGAMPFDVQEIQPDALMAASYKCMMGVYSIGFAYWGDRFAEAHPLEETWIGRKGSDDFRNLVDYQDEYQAGMMRMNVGEWANFALIPAVNASLRQLLLWQPKQVQEYCASLNVILSEQLQGTSFQMQDSRNRAEHLFGISIPHSLDVHRMQDELKQENVFVSLRGDFIRVSPSVYNTPEDMMALAKVLKNVWHT
jgi:selenocysteine lyase/cysteine desulfurase